MIGTVEKKRNRQLTGILFMVCVLCFLTAVRVSAKDVVIMLDPGHGGAEPGAARTIGGKTYREEIITLKISQYIKQELETYAGIKVYMTRKSNDVPFMGRETRILKGRNVGADAVVSIHINATSYSVQTTASGSCAAVPSYSYTSKSAKAARALGKTILKHLASDAGTKNNGYLFDDELGIILYGQKYKIPSMIIEHCYIDNPNDCSKFLSTDAKMKKLAIADAAGIAEYYKLTKKSDEPLAPPDPSLAGWQTENGERCYYTEEGVKVHDVWQKIDGKYYYFNSAGELETGVFEVDGDLYLTNKKGVRKKGFIKLNGNQYYADSEGKLYLEWQTYKGKKYYFDPNTGKAFRGLHKIGEDKYYFSKTNFAMQIGWQQISDTRRLYFNASDGRMLKNGWLRSQGKWYYLTSSGKPYTGTKKMLHGVWYTFDKNGVCTNR